MAAADSGHDFAILPDDGAAGTLLGRAWLPTATQMEISGPSPLVVYESGFCDLSSFAPKALELLALPDPVIRIGASEELRLADAVNELEVNRAP